MFHDVLNEKDFKNLEELKQITKVISDLYDKLCNLEINGNYKNEEYNKLYEYLVITLEVEKNLYKSMNLNYEKIVAFLELINMNLKNNVLEGIINQNYSDKINYRILKQFLNVLQINKECYNQYMKDMIESNFQIDYFDEDIITKETELDMALQSDINTLFIANLQELIDNDLYEIYKKQFIMTKYLYSFIEDDLTTIDNSLLLSISNFDVIGEYQNLAIQDRNQFIRDTQFANLKENIIKLLEIADYKCQNKNSLTKMLLRSCYIKAQLKTFELKDLVYIDEEIEEVIRKHNYFETHSICSSLIINLLREIMNDKALEYVKK